MGNILYVRLTVNTFDEKEVKKNFPSLYGLAWNEKDRYIPASQKFGLLELIDSLKDALDYADWIETDTKEIIYDDVLSLVQMKKDLQELILEWKVKEAHDLTYAIEDLFYSIEKKL